LSEGLKHNQEILCAKVGFTLRTSAVKKRSKTLTAEGTEERRGKEKLLYPSPVFQESRVRGNAIIVSVAFTIIELIGAVYSFPAFEGDFLMIDIFLPSSRTQRWQKIKSVHGAKLAP